MIQKWLTILIGAAWLVGSAAFGLAAQADGPQVLARVHFLGFDSLAAGTNAATLQALWGLPETAAFRSNALDKVAFALSSVVPTPGKSYDTNRAALIRPLLEDLLASESVLELTGRPGEPAAWAVAARLKPDRVNAWSQAWAKLTPLEKHQSPLTPYIEIRTNGWFVIGSGLIHGGGIPLLLKEMLAGKLAAPASGAWFAASADLAACAPVFQFGAGDWPKVELSMQPQGDGLRTTARASYPKPQPWALETWRVPTSTLRDPLISFTAMQGFKAWLARQEWFKRLGLDAVPNQLVAWGQSDTPFQIQLAVPVPNATNAMSRIHQNWLASLNKVLVDSPVETIEFHTNLAQITWGGWPWVKPFLRRAPEPAGEFLNAGLFPVKPGKTPAPEPLLEKVTSRTNLVYFDWEITQERLLQLTQSLGVFSPFVTLPHLPPRSVGGQWLATVGPKLGNTITEVTAISPQELSLVRRSHAGFNGLELLALASWFQSKDFPKSEYRFAFRPLEPVGKSAPPVPGPKLKH